MIMVTISLIFIINQINVMVYRQSTVVNSVRKIFPSEFNSRMHYIGKDNFYFSFTTAGYTNISILDKTYFNLQVFQVNQYRDEIGGRFVKTEYIELQLNKCGYRYITTIPNPAYDNIGVSQFICVDNTDYVIGGNLLSKETSKVKILLTRCTGQSYCKSNEEIDAAINSMSLIIAVTDYFFDIDDYSSPIKLNFRSDTAFGMSQNLFKLNTIKVKYNEITDQPNPLPFSSTNNYNFYSIGEISQDTYWAIDSNILEVDFVLDSEYQQTSRTVYRFSDFISQIGGFTGMLVTFSALFVRTFSSKIYDQSIMSK